MSSSSARGEESPPQEDQPVSREEKKKNGGKSDLVKARLASLLSEAFHNGTAFQTLAACTPVQVASCFPTLRNGIIHPGSTLTPSADVLQDKIASLTSTEQPPPKGIENAPPEAVRDTVLAGALIGSSEVLEGCLKNGADLTLRDAEGRHILHYLGVTGNASLLRKVLRRLEKTHGGRGKYKTQETFAQLLNLEDKQGWTPLAMAVARGNEEAVDAFLAYPELQLNTLLTHSCPPTILNQNVQSGPLHLAAISGHVSLVYRLLERGCQIEDADSHGRNIYHYVAALSNHTAALEFLEGISQHQKFVLGGLVEADYDGRTPLFVSIANGNLGLSERMLFLLRQQSEDSHRHLLHKDNLGMTAFHLAMLRSHHSMLFRAGRFWSSYSDQKSSLIEELGGSSSEECIMPVLMATLDEKWIMKDLSNVEQTVMDVIRSGLKTEEMHLPVLAQAIRSLGTESCLRFYRMAVEMEKRGEEMMAAPDRKRTLQGVFFKIMADTSDLNLDKVLAASTAPLNKALNASAPVAPRQTQSAGRHLRAPGFAGPRAAARSSSVSGMRRELTSSPRVPAQTHTLPLSPATGRRGTVTASTNRPASRAPSFAMPTKSVVLRGGRVERSNPATLRSGSRTAPPQRGVSNLSKSKATKPPQRSPTHESLTSKEAKEEVCAC